MTSRASMRRRAAWRVPAALAIVALSTGSWAMTDERRPIRAPEQPRAAVDDVIARAFDAAYSLDYEPAVALVEQAVAMAPALARAHRAQATITWLRLLFSRGAVTVDHYMGSVTRAPKDLPKPPADADGRFRAAIGRARTLAEAALAKDPRDLSARYDAGSVYALEASYAASIEGKIRGAFTAARRAFDAHETVLSRDPARVQAGVVVGTYRYLVATMALPTRVIAYMAGFGGGKDRGIALLQAAAQHPESLVDASTALLLVYSREGRHAEALAVAQLLERRYPRNRLFTLEAGAAAIRAGRAAEAEAILTRGWTEFQADPRTKIPGERAIWLYKRGLARVSLNHQPDARADLDAALAAGAPGWIEGRIRIELGKLHDLAGRRPEALREYHRGRELCRLGNDGIGEADAGRWIRRPFSYK